MDKASLRKHIKLKNLALSVEEKQRESEIVFSAIEKMVCFQSAQSVLFYHSLPDELPTHEVVETWATMKDLYLPRVKGYDLEIAPFGELVAEKRFGIEEPVAPCVDPSLIDLVIVPAVALDKNGNRLGRGKGFYDRFLPKCVNAYKIGVGFDCQIVDNLSVEAFDIPLDAVVSASKTYVINPFYR